MCKTHGQDIEAFRVLQRREAASLVRLGCKQFERMKSTVLFLGQEVEVTCESPDDEWEVRLWAALKGAACNSGEVPFMNWEAMLHSAGSLKGLPQFVNLPADLLMKISGARETAAGFIENSYCFKDMYRILSGKVKVLKSLDRSFVLELAYLEKHAAVIGGQIISERVIESLPDSGRQVAITQARNGNAKGNNRKLITSGSILAAPLCLLLALPSLR